MPAVLGGRGAVKKYLTTAEVAERLRRSPRTVEEWRQLDRGPRFVRIHDVVDKRGRNIARVLYPIAEVERYEQQLRTA